MFLRTLLLLALPAAAMAQVPDSSFGMHSRLTLEGFTDVANVAVGDADGDGRADLAVTDWVNQSGQYHLRLYFQGSDGSLTLPMRVPLPFDLSDISGVAMADLDGDGAREVVVGSHGGIHIVRWGATRLPSVTYHQGPASSCRIITTGDVDGDGRQDIACLGRNEVPNMAVVYFGNGSGGVRNTVGVELDTSRGTGGHAFRALAVGDVTGDGRSDLVVTSAVYPDFFVIPNDGNGGFRPPVAYAHPASPHDGWPVSVVVTDLDGDGVNEVVTANTENAPDGRLNIYRLGGAGSLELSRQIPIHSSTTALLVGDVGGDGDKDLVLGHWSYAAVSVLGDADARLETQARYELPGFGNDLVYTIRYGSTNAIALGDLNGDGCNDLASATSSGITLLYGCEPYARTLPVSDFDGDGLSDLYWWNGTWRDLWLRAGQERCLQPCPIYWGEGDWNQSAVGDFDGDGSSDLFLRRAEDGATQLVYRAFYREAGTTVQSPDWQVVGAGDFDGDDRHDLFWHNRRTGQTIIWWKGRYAGLTWELQVPDLGWQVATIGDFDGDGRSDVFWKHATSGRNIIWWQGRSAGRQEVTRVINTQWRVFGAGDFNQDGRDDIVWRNVATGAGILWYSGRYATQANLTTITNPDWRIEAVGDYDGDGTGDLLWRNHATGANIIWRGARYSQQQQVKPSDLSYRLIR